MTESQLKRAYAFTIVPNDFIKACELSHEAFRVYVVLCMHAPGGADANASVFPDYERLKALSGIRHNRTIATRMRELEDAGWLQRTKRFGQSTIYTLTIPSSGEPQSVTTRTNAHDDVMHSPSRGAFVHGVNDSPSPREPQSVTPSQTNKNHITRTKKQEEENARADARAPEVDSVDVAVQEETEKRGSLYGDCFVAVAEACALDHKVKSAAKRISVAAKYLAERKIEIGQVARFVEWWHANDWRGKQGDLPTPERFTELWLQFERGKPARQIGYAAPQTSSNGRTQRKAQAMFTDEQRRANEEQARRELEEEGEL